VSFTVENFRDLIKLLEEHPEWRAELRRLVLSEELLTMPERLDRLTRAVEQSDARLAAVEAALRELAVRQAEMAAALARLTERVDQLAASHATLRREFDDLKGWTLELRYERRLPSILGHMLRRARVATPVVFLEEIEDRISEEAFEELRNADLLVRGRLRDEPQRSVWLVVEVSSAIDPNDVASAARRAGLLRQAGEFAIPVVAGVRVTAEAEALLGTQPVVVIQDGVASGWEQALARWESPPAPA